MEIDINSPHNPLFQINAELERIKSENVMLQAERDGLLLVIKKIGSWARLWPQMLHTKTDVLNNIEQEVGIVLEWMKTRRKEKHDD